MRVTKKMRKKANGMNYATRRALSESLRGRAFMLAPRTGNLMKGKYALGKIPYVNVDNFV